MKEKDIINSIYGYFNHDPEFDQIDKVSPAGDSVFTSIERMQSGNIK